MTENEYKEHSITAVLSSAVTALTNLEKAIERHERLDQERFSQLNERLVQHKNMTLQVFIAAASMAAIFMAAYFTVKG